MQMDWPQIAVMTWLALGVMGHFLVALIVSLGGTMPAPKPKPKGVSQRWAAFIAKCIGVGITAWVLHAGRFWG